MTNIQHEDLAQAFKEFFTKTYKSVNSETVRQHLILGGWGVLLNRLCAVLLNDNHEFDQDKFMRGCGLG
jgi:Co/Zn/Cd efflux system component